MAHHAEEPADLPHPPQPATPNPQTASSEPAMSVGAVASAVALAVIVLLAAFGVDLTERQTEAILGVVAVVGPLLLAWITRGKVWSPKSVGQKVAAVRGGDAQ